MVTKAKIEIDEVGAKAAFPINRCHQQVVTRVSPGEQEASRVKAVPINRCHQQVVTLAIVEYAQLWGRMSFQPIGLTSEW